MNKCGWCGWPLDGLPWIRSCKAFSKDLLTVCPKCEEVNHKRQIPRWLRATSAKVA